MLEEPQGQRLALPKSHVCEDNRLSTTHSTHHQSLHGHLSSRYFPFSLVKRNKIPLSGINKGDTHTHTHLTSILGPNFYHKVLLRTSLDVKSFVDLTFFYLQVVCPQSNLKLGFHLPSPRRGFVEEPDLTSILERTMTALTCGRHCPRRVKSDVSCLHRRFSSF